MQFAHAFGCEVTAFSTSKDKEAEARELGAHHFVNTRETGALKKLAGCFDILLSTVSSDQDFQALVNALRPKGTPGDLAEMLDVAARHNVKALTERFPMKNANQAVARVKQNKVRYRAVLAN